MSKIILLPIISEYSERILSKEKTFEFRKNKFKEDVDTIVIYESRSCKVNKIVGYFKIDKENRNYMKVSEIIKLAKENISEIGISIKELKGYYSDKEYGYVIKIKELVELDVNHKEIFGDDFKAPQNYFYITYEQFDLIKEKNKLQT